MIPGGPKKIGIILALMVIAGGLGFLFFGKLEKNLVYFVTPSELLAKGEEAYHQPFRLGGAVKKGSIQWSEWIPSREAARVGGSNSFAVGGGDASPYKMTLQFLLTDGTREIKIISDQTPPQMFQEGMGVVVEGRLLNEGFFKADRLMVKHSNQYHPPKEGEKPALLYKDLVE